MMTEDTRPLVQVVAGILLDPNGRYLLSSRPEGKPYAGYWEFAGGKVEAGESDFQALQREFEEELGIRILAATPWLTKVHSYEHAHVPAARLRQVKAIFKPCSASLKKNSASVSLLLRRG